MKQTFKNYTEIVNTGFTPTETDIRGGRIEASKDNKRYVIERKNNVWHIVASANHILNTQI